MVGPYCKQIQNCASQSGWYKTSYGYEYREYYCVQDKYCGPGTIFTEGCGGGHCAYRVVKTCRNECSSSGQTYIYRVGNTVYKKVCGNYDNDPCLEWKTVKVCSDECSSGDVKTFWNGNTLYKEECVKDNSTQCYVWSDPIKVCTNECQYGEYEIEGCANINGTYLVKVKECDLNTYGCFSWTIDYYPLYIAKVNTTEVYHHGHENKTVKLKGEYLYICDSSGNLIKFIPSLFIQGGLFILGGLNESNNKLTITNQLVVSK